MDRNLYLFIQKPVYQALLFLLITPILIIILQPKTAETAWLISAYIFALFLIVNAGLLWFADKPWRYLLYSIGFTMLYLMLASMIIQGLIKLLQLPGSGEGAMVFLILIYQPFALLLVKFVKWAVTVR